MPGASGTTPALTAPMSASLMGRNGTGTDDCVARPASTMNPRPAAAAASSLTRRDFPTPGSPVTNTVVPRPRPASSTMAVRACNSAVRSMSTGHSIGPIARYYKSYQAITMRDYSTSRPISRFPSLASDVADHGPD